MTTTYTQSVVSNNAEIGQKRKLYEVVLEHKTRKSPFATKVCNICNDTHHVPSAQKSCTNEFCNGVLELVKQEKVLKRPPPMCSKFCVVCDIMIEDIPTATKTCPDCNNPLEKINKNTKPKIIHCKLVEK